MGRRRCEIEELNDERVAEFLNDWKRRGRLHPGHPATLHQFLTHLRARGVVTSPTPTVDDSPLGQWQQRYAQYLRAERGLAPATVTDYCRVLRWFLTDRFPLLTEVGEALVAYLRQDRPSDPTRRIFLCMKAPYRSLAGEVRGRDERQLAVGNGDLGVRA